MKPQQNKRKNIIMLNLAMLVFVLVLGSSCSHHNYNSNKYSKDNIYREFNLYSNNNQYHKHYDRYYSTVKYNKRKRVQKRFYEDKMCITFLRKKPKQPGNSVVKIYYPYEFVFLFLGRY